MSAADQDTAFLARRRKLARWWGPVGWFLLAGIAAVLAWMLLRTPLLVDPFEVIARLEQEAIPQSTLMLMATLLPVIWLLSFLLLLSVVLCQFAAVSVEKRLLRIIDARSKS
jgi:hypothetical protein